MTPGRPDRRAVERRLIALRRAVSVLRRHAGCTPQELRIEIERRWAIEHGLQLSAQAALEVATHLDSALGYDPATYGSSIDCLVEANVLPPSFGERFRRIAGFRNVIVHGYLDVDLDLIAEIFSGQLDDFEEFASHVERWFAESSSQ